MAFGLLPPAPKKYLWGCFLGVLEELWESFWGCGVLLEACLGDLGGLLWIHGYFFGHLVVLGGLGRISGGLGLPLGGFWEPLGSIWEPLGCQWLLFRGFVSENVKL